MNEPNKCISMEQAAAYIQDESVVTVSSSSGLGCPDKMLKAIGERFEATGHPKNITTLHPIAAGDMSGIKGIDNLARKGLLSKIVAGSYPSGPSSAEPPKVWKMLGADEIAAYNVPSGILFDMHREAAAKRPGVITKVGLGTFVDPENQGCAMNPSAEKCPVVKKIIFENEEYLYFPAIIPNVAIIRATTADQRGNLTYENEGAYLGGLDQALAVRNNGGIVIAQVKQITCNDSLKAHDVRVPGMLVDFIVVDPDQMQTTQTKYDPAISGEIRRPISEFRIPEFNIQKVISRRVALGLKPNSAVNLGFGVSANVPRILIEEGLHGSVTWVIEQGAVGGVPLLDFAFGCSSNADAYMPSPYQFTYFQGAGFDSSLLSFLEIAEDGSVNVSKLSFCPHVTAGCGGFVDITARARSIVFSGMFNAGAKVSLHNGEVRIDKEGKLKKLVKEVEHITFSGPRAIAQNQDITYVTERCVMKLTEEGIEVTEIAPGIDFERDIQSQCEFTLRTADDCRVMDCRLFQPGLMGMQLPNSSKVSDESEPHE